MGAPLLVWLHDGEDEPTYTVIQDGSAGQEAAAGPLKAADLVALASGRSVQVLLPSTDILLTRLQLPKTSAARLAQAIPYALEDHVADDVEALHFAFAVERDGIAVAVVARRTLDTWLQSLRAVSIEPAALIPDVLAVPRTPNTWSVLAAERVVLVRTGDRSGFAAEWEALAGCLDAALTEAKDQPPERLLIYGAAGDVEAVMAQSLSTTPPPMSCKSVDEGRLKTLLTFDPISSGLNFLQGAYAPRTAAPGRWMAWRLSAALALALLVVLGANEVVERSTLRSATEQADAELEALFRNTFPETRRIINPMAQMEQQLQALRRGQGGGSGDFLALLAEGGPSLTALGGVQLESLDYQNGRLDVHLIVRDVQALDELKRTLRSQPKLRIEILSATAADDAVRSRIRIERASS